MENSTQRVLYPFLVMSQCFALFPVEGIKGDDYRRIKFSWFLKRTIFSLFNIGMVFLNTCFFVVKLSNNLNTTDFLTTFVGLVYFVTVFFIYVFSIDLARKWPIVMKKWEEVDRSMVTYTSTPGLRLKLTNISLCVLVPAVIEHVLFILSRINIVNPSGTFLETVNIYLQSNYDPIFSIIPYNIYLGIFVQVFNIWSTVAWNYKDLLIILLSVILSSRFTQIVKVLNTMLQEKVVEQHKWRAIREDYVRLVLLCKLVDKTLSNIVLLSFAHNLFVILIQCLHTLYSSTNSSERNIYFIHSFAFIIIRTVMVCLYAGTIECESKKPLDILNTLPSEIYNIEVDRFITQVKIAPPYLSGRQFFAISRSLVLRIAGAIVTYELVLIQMYNAG